MSKVTMIQALRVKMKPSNLAIRVTISLKVLVEEMSRRKTS
jgi:hypothetical protein